MANINCDACDAIREDAPSLIVNGLGDTECTSLSNNTGLNPSSGNDDCEDLHNLNDCLVGNMAAEVDSYDVCDWKPFMKKFIPNVWTTIKAVICAFCGIWSNISNLWSKIEEISHKVDYISYVGILTLYRSSTIIDDSAYVESSPQVLAFSSGAEEYEGNVGDGVLAPTSDYKGIVIHNTTTVPLLVETIFNCSIRTSQHFACCYLTVTRDDRTVGQTPFITPTTYDQQVTAEAFVLEPGEATTMKYYFTIGVANGHNWYKNLFYPNTDPDAHMCLEAHSESVSNQGSFFKVKVTSIVGEA